jgi:hypothetical protein
MIMMKNSKQFAQAVLGAFAGFVFGIFGQVLLGQNESLGGRPLFPVEGAYVGAFAGLTFGLLLGNVQLKGRVKHACVGAVYGALIGILLGLLVGCIWPTADSKERAIFVGTGVVIGTPIVSSIGLILGLLRRNAS